VSDTEDLSRRDLLRRSAVGAATVGGVSAGAIRLDHGPVQESQAVAPAAVAGYTAAKAGGAASVGWALREFDPLGSDSPPEGLTEDGLRSRNFDIIQARQSNNQSTIIDNKNIVDGIGHSAWADAKIAAIDALNEQLSQDEVTDAGRDAARESITTVQKNFLNSWEETIYELYNVIESQSEHPDLSLNDGFDIDASVGGYDTSLQGFDVRLEDNEDVELADGTEMTISRVEIETAGNSTWYDYHDPTGDYGDSQSTLRSLSYEYEDYETEPYLLISQWQDLYGDMNDELNDVLDGITLWVDEIYEDVKSGELDTDELLTPREQAELTSDDEDFPQAIADLQALNVGVDLEREAEIYLPEVGATLYGQLAYSGDESLEVGEIDPDATDDDDDPLYPGTIYFNYDISQGRGEWDAYDDGIDGGTLTLTSEPFEDTIYYVDTAAGETAEFVTDDLTENDDGDEWTVDLSYQLDDQITEVDQIEYYAETEETQYETIQLQEPFEIVTFTDSDGEEYEETDFERSEPHDDDNYITEEEWIEQQERHEELIEKYEDAQGGGGLGFLDGEEIPAEGVVLIVLAVFAALFGR